MSKVEDITKEVHELVKAGMGLSLHDKANKDIGVLAFKYESWYSRALAVVKQLLPDRVEDFRTAYKLDRRKDVTYDTYTIADYLVGLVVKLRGEPTFDTDQAYQTKLLRQLSILKSAADLSATVLRDIRTILRAELFDSDVEAAKALAKAKHLRSAGVVCGVVLEAHMKSVAASHGVTFTKKNLTIGDLNDGLKDNNIIDVPMWRFIQRLADIRNLCGHSKDRDPKPDEVADLISGTDKVLKEVF